MLVNENLVRVTKYSNKIRELPITKRISVDYPIFCRESVASMLSAVAAKLPEDIFLQIDSAYRTRETQKILWKARKDVMPGLVYNPENGVPPHCTGGAVDVSLVDKNGVEINLSEPFPRFYDEPQLVSEKISVKAQKLRSILNKIMLETGFASNPEEYWHFSFGDEMWADYYGQEQKYGEISLSKKYYFPFYRRLYFKIRIRISKLINKYFVSKATTK